MKLEVRNLKKTYGTVQALKGINYTFTPGVYGILGANGAGKSTMINLITDNVSRDKMNGGSILFGEDSAEEDILKLGKQFRGLVGYMPQQQGFYEDFSPKAFLKYMAEIKGVKKNKTTDENGNEVVKTVNQQIDELLEVVNLTKVAYKKIGGFSGGMKQRVLLAQALLGNPKILILDEPTAGLDVEARNEILDLLREYIAQDEKRTILITSHISTDLESLCDDIYLIHDGKIILHEDTDVILEQYGILKVDEEQYRTLDKTAVIRAQKETYGYACFTNDRRFYQENYPQIVVEHGGIDELILMMTGGYR